MSIECPKSEIDKSIKRAKMLSLFARIHLIAYIPIILIFATAILLIIIFRFENEFDYNVIFSFIIIQLMAFMLASTLFLLSIILGFIVLKYTDDWRKNKIIIRKIKLSIFVFILAVAGDIVIIIALNSDGYYLIKYIYTTIICAIIMVSLLMLSNGRLLARIGKSEKEKNS